MVVDSTIRFNDRMDGPSVSLGSKLSNAKVSFAIFKRDIKRLLVNPVALVVTLGVCVIPSLYAWYNIVANWDPYGNTQGIKIAIANNDQGSELHNAAALNGLGNAVDGDDLGDHAVIFLSSLHGHCIFSLLTVSGRLHGHLQQVP